jgi:hypothetical protein
VKRVVPVGPPASLPRSRYGTCPDFEIDRDAVEAHRGIVRILHAQLQIEAHLEAFAGQRLDAGDADAQRIAA